MNPQAELPLSILFILLLSLAGPIKLIPVFAALAGGADAPARRKLAVGSGLYAVLGIAVAVLAGHAIMTSWRVSHEALGAAAGLVLMLVALPPMISSGGNVGAPASPPSLPSAIAFAFPTIVPPYAFGVVILFAAYFTSVRDQIAIIALGAAVTLINVLAMLFARQAYKIMGEVTLRILGAVFSILQLSLGMEMLYWSLKVRLLQ